GLVTEEVVCLPTKDGLLAVRPLDGRVLWSRRDLPRNIECLHDGRYLFLVEVDARGLPLSTRALSIVDGTTIPLADFSIHYARRHQVFGGMLVVAEKGEQGSLVMRQYDVLNGKDLWKKTFAPGTIILTSHNDALAGSVEPNGKVTVFDLKARKELLAAQ